MLSHLTRRVGQYVLVLLVAVALNFMLPRAMPGSPLGTIGGEQVGQMTQAGRDALLEEYGLDQSLARQFVTYLADIARGDLGRSFDDRQPVTDAILVRLPWTLLLVGSGLVVTTVLGVLLGIRGGARRERARDSSSLAVFLALDAFPPFWVGMLLILVFSVQLGWFPAFGAAGLERDLGLGGQLLGVLRHLALPLVTLVIAQLGQTYLITRYSMLSVMGQEYMFMARAKGLPERLLLRRHAFRNAVLPVHTLVMLELGRMLGGVVVIEAVFGYPGLGRLLYDAVVARDFPLLQGAFLLLTVSVIVMNLLADLSYPLLDPRIRRPAAELA